MCMKSTNLETRQDCVATVSVCYFNGLRESTDVNESCRCDDAVR